MLRPSVNIGEKEKATDKQWETKKKQSELEKEK